MASTQPFKVKPAWPDFCILILWGIMMQLPEQRFFVVVQQELINNTSLAELEKQVKEIPFKPPHVGEWLLSELPERPGSNLNTKPQPSACFIPPWQKLQRASPVMTQPRSSSTRRDTMLTSPACVSSQWPTIWVKFYIGWDDEEKVEQFKLFWLFMLGLSPFFLWCLRSRESIKQTGSWQAAFKLPLAFFRVEFDVECKRLLY